MAKYDVNLLRTGFSFATITVDADSCKEAEQKALEEAGDHEYSEKNAEYTASCFYLTSRE